MMKSFIYTFCTICLISPACTRHQTNAGEKRVKNGPTIEIGAGAPEIMSVKNDTASIALFPRAQYFFIDLHLKRSEQNIRLIKQANRLGIPVRTKVFKDNVHEIAEIYPANDEEIKNYQKSKIRTE
ncbi:hypothetical protein [Pedobacter lusitanus]|uniref:hypothetical protein n=1 Tax=Pedobacter lusitanus TaxID=1503925 RepID=UPI0032B014CF